MSQAPISQDRVPIKRALVSVYDKTGLEDLVRALHDAGVSLVSTGGSAKLIEAAQPMAHRHSGTEAHSGALSDRASTTNSGRNSEKNTSYFSDHSAEFDQPVDHRNVPTQRRVMKSSPAVL